MSHIVLIVDDEEFALRMTTRTVQRLGYKTLNAANGVEAISIAKENKPSVVISDYYIPDFGADDLITAFGTLTPRPYIIAVSSGTFRADITSDAEDTSNPVLKKALEMGADAVLQKPIQAEKLQKILHAIPLPAYGTS